MRSFEPLWARLDCSLYFVERKTTLPKPAMRYSKHSCELSNARLQHVWPVSGLLALSRWDLCAPGDNSRAFQAFYLRTHSFWQK